MKQLLLLLLLLVSFFCTSAEESVEKVMKLISQLGYEASIAQNEGKYPDIGGEKSEADITYANVQCAKN